MKSLARIVLVVSLMVSIGGHWGMLQAIAWAKMLRAYTEERGLIAGLKDTFDGDHACSMCEKIATGKQKDKQENLPLTKVSKENLARWYGTPTAMSAPDADGAGETQRLGHATPPSMTALWDAPPPVPPPESVTV